MAKDLDYSRLLRIIQSSIPPEKPPKSYLVHTVQDGNYTVTFESGSETGLMYGNDLRTLQWIFLEAAERDGMNGRLCCFMSYKSALQQIGLPVSPKNKKWLHGSLDRICSARIEVKEAKTQHCFMLVIATKFWLDDEERLIDLEFPEMHEITLTDDGAKLAFELQKQEA